MADQMLIYGETEVPPNGNRKKGTNLPSGLQAEVLQGLYNVALTIEQDEDHKNADMIKGLVVLGIGALIFYLLTRNR